MNDKDNITVDEKGYFGEFGGQYVPNNLKAEFLNIYEQFKILIKDADFNNTLSNLYAHYSGRPTPVYFAGNLSEKYGNEIYLKREDLNHTGAHKLNHCLGEALLAKKMGKKKVIAETGAGQHGIAIATAAALLGLQCDIYMGKTDIQKARTNVERMRILGANIISVEVGTMTLKEAVDASFAAYKNEYKEAFYAIGSVVGPHPFPSMVEYFQSVVGREAREQFMQMTGKLPDYVVACVGGGSNAIGIFNGFASDEKVKLIGVEPLGKGTKIGQNAASINFGKIGVLHGFKSYVLQNDDGSVADAYSVASGLDYPSVGPKHAYLHKIGRAEYEMVDDNEAIDAFYELSRNEGIVPALESSHALAYALKLSRSVQNKRILVNLSGRGDKDIEFILQNYPRR